MLARSFVYRALKQDGTGPKSMKVDGATINIPFRLVSDGTRMTITRLLVTISDTAIQFGKFGGIPALTNGLTVKAHDVDGAVLMDFLDGGSIKSNCEWASLAGMDLHRGDIGDHFSVRWTLEKAGDQLHLEKGQYLEILVRDDLSAIDSMSVMAQGFYNPK